MRFVQQPWSMCKDFINLIEVSQFLWYVFQSSQPSLISTLEQEFCHLDFDYIRTLMPASGLENTKQQRQH